MTDNRILGITFDDDTHKNVIIVPEHWSNGQTGFENADAYVVLNGEDEALLDLIGFTEDKSDWESNGKLSPTEEEQIVAYIKGQSPLTDL